MIQVVAVQRAKALPKRMTFHAETRDCQTFNLLNVLAVRKSVQISRKPIPSQPVVHMLSPLVQGVGGHFPFSIVHPMIDRYVLAKNSVN